MQSQIISEKFDLSERGARGVDVVYECSGAEVCVQTGLWITKRRGQFIQVRVLCQAFSMICRVGYRADTDFEGWKWPDVQQHTPSRRCYERDHSEGLLQSELLVHSHLVRHSTSTIMSSIS